MSRHNALPLLAHSVALTRGTPPIYEGMSQLIININEKAVILSGQAIRRMRSCRMRSAAKCSAYNVLAILFGLIARLYEPEGPTLAEYLKRWGCG
ncbi:hypothetical protein AOQ72_16045 [Bradyrhizobium yuanmingense]|uniref:Uncharacterized protein n=2 Tax=Bradyrhizobium yuanmingense TaxID=108015 RepID=A0A0R3CSG0_9BRAD|nr:hypothetical protein AOQ72_16045 [Bradyrhizobium yuanmingense]